jgi:hypothetical protein
MILKNFQGSFRLLANFLNNIEKEAKLTFDKFVSSNQWLTPPAPPPPHGRDRAEIAAISAG